MAAEREAPVRLVTHVNNILHSIFSNVEVYINNQQIYNSNELYAPSLTFPTTSRGLFLNKKEFCTAKCTTMKSILMKFWKRIFLNLFHKEKENA